MKRYLLSRYIMLRNLVNRVRGKAPAHPSEDKALTRLGIMDGQDLILSVNAAFGTRYSLFLETQGYVLLEREKKMEEHIVDWMVFERVYAALDIERHIPRGWKFSLWK